MFEISGLFTSPNPRWILDLFCGAGGSTRGYQYAGFNVIGVDHAHQPRYCGDEFHRGDALEYLASWLEAGEMPFAAIHASPPCQHFSILKYIHPSRTWPDLLAPTRKLLKQTGLPYIIENVEFAPLKNPAIICGTERGLGVGPYRLRRHRKFETNWELKTPDCICWEDDRLVIDVTGGGGSVKKHGLTYKGSTEEASEAMGIDWMIRDELNEAVPPCYTELIGGQLNFLLTE